MACPCRCGYGCPRRQRAVPAPPPPKRGWGDETAVKGVPAEPLAPRGFVCMLTFGLQSEAEMEAGQTVPRKEDVVGAPTTDLGSALLHRPPPLAVAPHRSNFLEGRLVCLVKVSRQPETTSSPAPLQA